MVDEAGLSVDALDFHAITTAVKSLVAGTRCLKPPVDHSQMTLAKAWRLPKASSSKLSDWYGLWVCLIPTLTLVSIILYPLGNGGK